MYRSYMCVYRTKCVHNCDLSALHVYRPEVFPVEVRVYERVRVFKYKYNIIICVIIITTTAIGAPYRCARGWQGTCTGLTPGGKSLSLSCTGSGEEEIENIYLTEATAAASTAIGQVAN